MALDPATPERPDVAADVGRVNVECCRGREKAAGPQERHAAPWPCAQYAWVPAVSAFPHERHAPAYLSRISFGVIPVPGADRGHGRCMRGRRWWR